MEVMVAVGGVLEEELVVYVILISASLASLSSERLTYLVVVPVSMASDALIPADQVVRLLARHQRISETAVDPRFTQGVQDPEEGSGRDA
jgi:hypothetical protein